MLFRKSQTAAVVGPDGEILGTAAMDSQDLRAAYDRGRLDERRARKRHPLGMTLMILAAAVGGVVLALAVKEGSFSRGGDIVDHNLAAATDQAEPAVRNAASDAGQALKDAGRSLKDKAHDATAPAPVDPAH
jgi:hypothetical protein